MALKALMHVYNLETLSIAALHLTLTCQCALANTILMMGHSHLQMRLLLIDRGGGLGHALQDHHA